MFAFLKDDTFLRKYTTEKVDIFGQEMYILQLFLSDLNHLSKTADTFIYQWNEIAAVSIIFKVIKLLPQARLTGYLIISAIYNDTDIDILEYDFDAVVSVFANFVSKCASDFQNGATFLRAHGEFLIDKELQMAEGYTIDFLNVGINTSILSIFTSMYSLAINSKLKAQLNSMQTIKNNLNIILNKGNKFEQIKTLDLLIQLSFDGTLFNENYNHFITEAANGNNDSIKRRLEYLKWILNELKRVIANPNRLVTDALHTNAVSQRDFNLNSTVETSKKIMISYANSSSKACLEIKKRLEEQRYNILTGGILLNDKTKSKLNFYLF